jgi:type IV pilus assembly protein PilQ
MTLSRGFALLAVSVLSAAVATTDALVSASSGAGTPVSPRLKTISSRVHAKGTSLVIEATEPVAYIATRPDPLTVVVDFRNVATEGVAKTIASNEKSPIAAVSVEPDDSLGTPGSRVRIELTQPVAHRVRSERSTIVVDFDKPSADGALYVRPARSAAPDAMLALVSDTGTGNTNGGAASVAVRKRSQPQPIQDPITALGLTKPAPPAAAPQTAGARTIQPTTPTPGDTTQPAPPTGGRRYTGHPISLDFQGADLRAVLRTFAEISGLNIVIEPAVQGTVDVALRDVPWDQALDIILRANKLGYIVDGTIVRIAPLSVLADEQSQQRKLQEEQALAGELRVLTKTLSYAKAEELQALLTKSALSQRGTVQIDPRTNTLIITDLSDRLTTANELIATLDRAQPQVEIEARIVQAAKNYARQLGVQWGFNGRVDPALGNTTPFAFPNNGSVGGRTGGAQGPAGSQVPTAINYGVPGASSAVGLALGSINGAFNLDVALSALESSGNGRILSTPRVTTQNNVAAEMTQGTQIPIQTVANNTVTVTFKDAALTLKVTPQITAAGTVIMLISLENSQADFTRAINGIPPINTQRANTSVLVSDGQTTVIGGVFVSNEQYQTDKTPGLGSIPLLRWLFKRDLTSTNDQELLIFITPRILKG